MRALTLTLPAELLADLAAAGSAAAGLPATARWSTGAAVADLVRRHLAELRAARRAAAAAVVQRYWPVVRAVAAREYQRCRGLVPLDELLSAAGEEAVKGAQRFDAALGHSPAPYLRTWAMYGARALIAQRLGEAQQLVRPDQDTDGSRWEKIGGADVDAELAPERAELRAVITRWVRAQPPARRRLARALVRGLDDDQVVAATGCALVDVDAVRAELRQLLRAHDLAPVEDELLTPAAAARTAGVPVKAVHKALAAGRLAGRKREGGWLVRAADVRAWLRRRGA